MSINMRRKRSCFNCLLIASLGIGFLILAVMFLSGRTWFGWSSTIDADGSQWHIDIRYGAIRWMWGERDTIIVGSPPGWHVHNLDPYSLDWWPPMIEKSSYASLVMIPLWLLVPPLLIVAGFAIAWRNRVSRGSKAAKLIP